MDNLAIGSLDFNDENVQRIIDLINCSIYWKDVDGHYLGCNKYLLDMAGVANRKDIIGKTDYDMAWKNYADQLRVADKFVLENGYYKGEEIGIILGNQTRFFMTTKNRLIDKFGQTVIFGHSIDITDAKKQMALEKQEAILEEESKTMQILDLVEASIFWRDLDGRILGCNQYALDLFGMKNRSEFIGKNQYDMLPFTEAEKISASDKLTFENGFFQGEERTTSLSNGKELVFVTSKKPLFDNKGNIIGSVGVAIDITDKKEKERIEYENRAQMLKDEQDSKTMQILDLVDASIFWRDIEGRILGCNQYALDLLGINNRSDIIGKTEYDLLPDDEAQKITNTDKLTFDHGFYRGEDLITPAHTSREMVFLTSKRPLLDNDGNIIGSIGVSIDITDKKEKELLEAEVRKQELLAEEHKKFEKSVGKMVHDIRTPSSSIDLVIKQIREGKVLTDLDKDTLDEANMQIRNLADKLLLQYTTRKVEADTVGDFLVSTALKKIMDQRIGESRDSNVKFEVDISRTAAFAFIKHNSFVFKRMVSNLLNNAVDALKDQANPKIEVTLFHNQTSNKLMFVIRDNGYGMPVHIQEKFKAGISVTEGKENGHGIGLTQILEAIQLGNGELSIFADKDGTEITIWFPGVKEAPRWSTREIRLTKDDIVVVLDDDKSIHGAWDTNFQPIVERVPTINVRHYTDWQEAITFINGLSMEQKQDVFLWTDYDLSKEPEVTGMDVINQTNIRRAVVVTSFFDKPDVQLAVIERGVKLLPKEMAFQVKFLIDHKIEKGSKKVDMVWVEDQEAFVRDRRERYYPHLNVDIYTDPVVFMENVLQYPLDTRIILDTYYDIQSESLTQHEPKFYLDGYQIAKELHDIGYTKLIMLVGEMPPFTPPDYLIVLLKGEHEIEANLDKY